jgi:hypothetical protein
MLERETSPADWVIVDRPILAFLANRPVPPALAMISRKRVRTVMTDGDLTGAIDRYAPAMVVLCRGLFSQFGDFRARLDADYLAIRRFRTQVGAARSACVFFRKRT